MGQHTNLHGTARWNGSLRAAVAISLGLLAWMTMVKPEAAQAQTFSVLHEFDWNDGADPSAGLTIAGAGTFYGTAGLGGTHGGGVAFKLAQRGLGWILTPLYDFSPNANYLPAAGLTIGPGGVLYGTNTNNGDSGTVYELQPPSSACKSALCYWSETVLYNFNGDGFPPSRGNVIFDQAGNIYGTTTGGYNGSPGTAYETSRSNGQWTTTMLHTFTGGVNDGWAPQSSLILDSAGNLYGTTAMGGADESCNIDGVAGCGTIFELIPSGGTWTEKIIYNFSNNGSGTNPYGSLISDGAGGFYGTTFAGGAGGSATVFQLTPSGGGWNYSVLSSLPNCQTYTGVTMDGAGNLFGVCSERSMVFELSKSGGNWVFTDLHDFHATDGADPIGPVALDAEGNLYGTTYEGGNFSGSCQGQGCGVIWEIAGVGAPRQR